MGDRNISDVELSDAELVELLRNHGLSRRRVLQLLGGGALVSAASGAAAGGGGRNADIDDVFGAAYSTDESPPRGLPDHEVGLRGPPESGTPVDEHKGFPMVDSPDDGDTKPDKEVAEFYFEPVGLAVEPGDVVQFTVEEDHLHTVTSFRPKYEGLPDRIPGDASPFTAPPVAGDESWLYRFDTSGVYDIVCLPHLVLGMVMRVVVFDPRTDDRSALTDYGSFPNPPGPGDPFANAEAVLTDSALDPGDVLDAGEVAWGDLSL